MTDGTPDLEKTLKIARLLQDACELIDQGEGGGAFTTAELVSFVNGKLEQFGLGLRFDPLHLTHRVVSVPRHMPS